MNPKWEGPWDPTGKKYKTDDVNWVEVVSLAPLAAIIIFIGIQPHYILNMMTTSVNHLISVVEPFVR
jgi:NADH:ubiquinone oxidoreductase subunit 4 (subunit M)